MISHKNKLYREILQIDRIALVKTLLEESPFDTFIQIKNRSLYESTLTHLINETSWDQYKNDIDKKIKETSAIVNHLKANFSNEEKAERMQFYEKEKQLYFLYTCKSINDDIDDFIRDTVLQEIISEKNEIRKYHSDARLEEKFKQLMQLKLDYNTGYIKKFYSQDNYSQDGYSDDDHLHDDSLHDDHLHDDHSHDDHSDDEHLHDDHSHDDHSDDEHLHDDHSHNDHSDDEHLHDDYSHDDHSDDDHSHDDYSYDAHSNNDLSHDDQMRDAKTTLEKTNALTHLQLAINDLENEINHLLCKKAKNDKALFIRLKTIELLEKEKFKSHHDAGHKINANLITEESMEMISTSGEFIAGTDEKIHVFNIFPEESEVSESSDSLQGQEHLTLFGEFLRVVPLANDFIRGLIYLREGYSAIKNKETSHRDLKIGTAVLGSSLSIGMGIVGALLLSGVGLMATASAMFLTPIILGAAIIGVFSITLARDSLVLNRLQKQTKGIDKHLTSINKELSLSREIFVSNYIHDLKNTDSTLELISIQKNIDELRAKIKNSPDAKITQDITKLCEKRNNLIGEQTTLSNEIHDAYQKDPRIMRITLQRVKCLQTLHKMENTKITAKKKVGLSALSMVSFALIFSTLFIPGIGALIIGGIATAAVLTVSAKRLYDSYQGKKEPNMQKINKNAVILSDKANHTSVLRIDKKLFAEHQHQVAEALTSDSPYLKKDNKCTISTPKLKVEQKQLTPEEDDSESFNQHQGLTK